MEIDIHVKVIRGSRRPPLRSAVQTTPLSSSIPHLDSVFATLGITPLRRIDHPPVHTIEAMLPYMGPGTPNECQERGAILVKNLFLKDRKKGYVLLTACYDSKFDIKEAGKGSLGAKDMRFADIDKLGEVLGVIPGSVTPLAIVSDKEKHQVTLALDSRLKDYRSMLVHPLAPKHNEQTLEVKTEDFLKLTSYTGHVPVWIDMSKM